MPQFATANSPEHASSARNMQFIPYVFASRERILDHDEDTLAPKITRQTVHREGLDAKIVMHDSLTLDATVNPDFSQVESDEPQVTTNQRYEVFFPEKRPFFLENTDFFDTPETLLFTRRIVDPQFGLRLSGKIGNWKIGMLAVDDRAPGRQVLETDPLDAAHALNFAGRLQRLFGGSSSLGVMFTRRQFGPASTNLGSIDTRLKLGENWVFTGQYMRSFSLNNGADLAGSAAFAELRHASRRFNSTTTYLDRSADFAGNDLGFFRRTDIRQVQQKFEFLWRPERGALLVAGPLPSGFATWNHAGQLQDWSADLPLYFSFKGPSSLTVGRTESQERYRGIDFRKSNNYVSFSSDRLRWIGVNGFFSQGQEINFFPAAGLLPVLGGSTTATAGITFKPGSRLQMEQKYLFSRLLASDRLILEEHILRTKVNFQFSRPLSLRAIIDYDTLGSNPSLVDLESRTRRLNFDLLFTYFVHPGTAIYVGYSDQYQNLLIDPTDPTGLRRIPGLGHPTARQLFVKLSYSFRF
ncbi:MAG: DUF5916 domain-containing protein [Acidobacteriia bacterium]|nr:DUF5916 domain-containing protein [Terriglobia bacterium]